MHLNTLKPAVGAKKAANRVGRGIGSGSGKTCGKGHKGQKARSGGFHKVGFEGGQMPLQRRVPKFGFTSRKSLVTKKFRLDQLSAAGIDEFSLKSMKSAGLISNWVKFVRIYKAGEINRAVVIHSDIHVTKGARENILAANGKVEK